MGMVGETRNTSATTPFLYQGNEWGMLTMRIDDTGGSILLALHQILLQPDQLSPKCLADHPTSPTTAGNVQTAIAIRKMDACVAPEDISNTRYKSVSSTVCVLYTSIL